MLFISFIGLRNFLVSRVVEVVLISIFVINKMLVCVGLICGVVYINVVKDVFYYRLLVIMV